MKVRTVVESRSTHVSINLKLKVVELLRAVLVVGCLLCPPTKAYDFLF